MHYVAVIAKICTHMREKLYDVLAVVELIWCFLLQEGKPAMKKSDQLISGQNKTLFFLMAVLIISMSYLQIWSASHKMGTYSKWSSIFSAQMFSILAMPLSSFKSLTWIKEVLTSSHRQKSQWEGGSDEAKSHHDKGYFRTARMLTERAI